MTLDQLKDVLDQGFSGKVETWWPDVEKEKSVLGISIGNHDVWVDKNGIIVASGSMVSCAQDWVRERANSRKR